MTTEIDETPRDGNQAPDPLDGWIHRDELNARINAWFTRRIRRLRGLVLALATALLGVAGGVIKAHGDGRAADERVLARLDELERRVRELREDERQRLRDEIQRLQAPRSAAPSTIPTAKGSP